jgi:hypothetical protein
MARADLPDPHMQAKALGWWFQFQGDGTTPLLRNPMISSVPKLSDKLISLSLSERMDSRWIQRTTEGVSKWLANLRHPIETKKGHFSSSANMCETRSPISQRVGTFMCLPSVGMIWRLGYLTARDVTVQVRSISTRSRNDSSRQRAKALAIYLI